MANYDASYLTGLVNDPDQSPLENIKSSGGSGVKVQDEDGIITQLEIKGWWGQPTTQST